MATGPRFLKYAGNINNKRETSIEKLTDWTSLFLSLSSLNHSLNQHSLLHSITSNSWTNQANQKKEQKSKITRKLPQTRTKRNKNKPQKKKLRNRLSHNTQQAKWYHYTTRRPKAVEQHQKNTDKCFRTITPHVRHTNEGKNLRHTRKQNHASPCWWKRLHQALFHNTHVLLTRLSERKPHTKPCSPTNGTDQCLLFPSSTHATFVSQPHAVLCLLFNLGSHALVWVFFSSHPFLPSRPTFLLFPTCVTKKRHGWLLLSAQAAPLLFSRMSENQKKMKVSTHQNPKLRP